MRPLLTIVLCSFFIGCAQSDQEPAPTAEEPQVSESPQVDSSRLAAVLADQPEEMQARYGHRHPQETLEFFGVTPGMNVVEALPGGGWYTKVLLPYLGDQGHVTGVDYSLDMWPKFSFVTEDFLESKKTWVETWTTEVQGWRSDDSANVSAFVFGAMPEDAAATADAVLFVRALHNLARFENDGGYLTQAIDDAYRVLKPGGIVGVVQHHARDTVPDDWALGNRGYLKKGFVIEAMKDRGFEFVGESDVNANPKDEPADGDVVWRLPPTLATSREDAELQDQLKAVGESNRMTLKFRKPM